MSDYERGVSPEPESGTGGGYQDPGDAGAAGGPPPWASPLVATPVRARRSGLRAVAAGALGVLVAAVCGVAFGWGLTRVGLRPSGGAPAVSLALPGTSTSGAGGNLSAAQISARVDPAVVDVNTVVVRGGRRSQAAGTGMIITASGEVLTNNHVVQGGTAIEVTLAGGASAHHARVIGVDPTADVALIQIAGVSGLPTVSLADSSSVKVGERVVAIGNALGRGGTPPASSGTVTAVDRSIDVADDFGGSEHLTGLIQIDAPISPGDSGGPLVDPAGQVMGMITAAQIGGLDQTSSQVGYAIPSTTAVSIARQMASGRSSGDVLLGQPGYLGVDVRDLDSTTASRLGLDASSGALVLGVISGSPAAQAGIMTDAVITTVNGAPVSSSTELGTALHRHQAGAQVQVTWIQGASTHTATVTLEPGPAL
ncbi:MAG: S1C family serine protease [Candidatus Dormibacterales bacterium]